ncbi:hypothetical protein VNO78_18403 [Psophocarpus tetragonolobus]|uniref:Uncharacterized protein n=1 Tax=Psophocarpus tetragonolobus TaxID=3891 RepID=A0AAN9SJS9_PSOTE
MFVATIVTIVMIDSRGEVGATDEENIDSFGGFKAHGGGVVNILDGGLWLRVGPSPGTHKFTKGWFISATFLITLFGCIGDLDSPFSFHWDGSAV